MSNSRTSQFIRAPRAEVYRACIDPALIVRWRVPDTMTAKVYSFETRKGGGYRMSLTYRDPARPAGKTTGGDDGSYMTGQVLHPNGGEMVES